MLMCMSMPDEGCCPACCIRSKHAKKGHGLKAIPSFACASAANAAISSAAKGPMPALGATASAMPRRTIE